MDGRQWNNVTSYSHLARVFAISIAIFKKKLQNIEMKVSLKLKLKHTIYCCAQGEESAMYKSVSLGQIVSPSNQSQRYNVQRPFIKTGGHTKMEVVAMVWFWVELKMS